MRYAVNGYIQMSGSHTEAGIKWDDLALHWSALGCMLSKSPNIYNQILNLSVVKNCVKLIAYQI